MQDVAVASERSTEDNESLVDERVHKAGVLVPAVLFAQTARPIPWSTTLEPDCEEHRLKPYGHDPPRARSGGLPAPPDLNTSVYRLGIDRGSPNHGSTVFSKRVIALI